MFTFAEDGREVILYDLEKSFRESINSIKRDFNCLVRENKGLRATIKEYDKTAGISAKENEIHSLQQRSIAILFPKEHERDVAFRNQHYQRCKNGNHFIYDIQGTGFGAIIKIKCPVCGVEEDITDTESW